ncbi:hypothetical protein BDQ12DRAFT_594984 [Crucibulum laeve]|uniref:Pentatricopeptide repeat-containing protein-mitochondrial domain-containing protein n=1 Tax=Crucibulum laeve TaxID=68775 RepID=A0A5C3MJS7_9AGAR|nr:hypothetical protein BDQ12DRAFT_594984 [Crucibulum laeve]
MVAAADTGRFSNCLSVATDMKRAGVNPDITTYNSLLSTAANDGHWLEAWAILDDMLLLGIQPTATSFNHLIRAQHLRPIHHVWMVLDKMNSSGVQPNSTTYSLIIERMVALKNLELAVLYLYNVKARGMSPELIPAQSVIVLAAQSGHPRLAIDLAVWFEQDSVRRLDHVTWMNCLIASADSFYAEGVQKCWNTVIHELNITPDEGLCTAVLHTAARHGLVDIAIDVLRALDRIGVSQEEHHVASLIEAHVRGNQLKDAMLALQCACANNIQVGTGTILPILNLINRDIDGVDAASTVVDQLYKDGQHINVVLLQLILQAAVSLGDLQRAVGTYKSYAEYDVKPNLATFNVLLEGCVTAGHRQLGDLLLADMKAAKIKADCDTYENMVYLCLTQDIYEDAFFYLEEMKSAEHVPPPRVYEALAQKCIINDDSRYTLVLEEMRECGYQTSHKLRQLVKEKTSLQSIPAEQHSIDGNLLNQKALQFIETGGASVEQGSPSKQP